MIDLTNGNAILTQKITSRLFDHETDRTELVLNMLFAIIVSETLAFLLYRMISTFRYSQNHFYSTFSSYTSFMYELIDDNEGPSIPVNGGMSRSISRLSLEERKQLIDEKLTTRRLNTSKEGKDATAGTWPSPKIKVQGDFRFMNFPWQHDTRCESITTSMETKITHNSDEDTCAICLVEFSKFCDK